MNETLNIYTDGGARGNPGPAGIGYVIVLTDGKILAQEGRYIGPATNNQAEYEALITALGRAADFEPLTVNVYMDSELVVRQMTGRYKIKHAELKPLAAKVLSLKKNFKTVNFLHIPREKNYRADSLVNEAIDKAMGTEQSLSDSR